MVVVPGPLASAGLVPQHCPQSLPRRMEQAPCLMTRLPAHPAKTSPVAETHRLVPTGDVSRGRPAGQPAGQAVAPTAVCDEVRNVMVSEAARC